MKQTGLLSVMVGLVSAALVLFMVGVGAAPNNFVLDKATNSAYSSNVRPIPAYVDAVVLVANTAQSQLVPTSARWVLFSSSCGVIYVIKNATAAVPAATTTTGAAPELNPAAYDLRGNSARYLSLISPYACVVTMAFYY